MLSQKFLEKFLQNPLKLIYAMSAGIRKVLPVIQALSCLAVLISAVVQISLNLGWLDKINEHRNSSSTRPVLGQVKPPYEK